MTRQPRGLLLRGWCDVHLRLSPRFGVAGAVLAVLWMTQPLRADEAAWKSAHDAGWAAFEKGQLAEAEASLTVAAKELRAFPPDDPRVALTLDHLAWAYLAQGKFDLA
jgi:hypothetical protein